MSVVDVQVEKSKRNVLSKAGLKTMKTSYNDIQ